MVKFGPSGNETKFYESGYKHSYQMPEYLAKLSLEAYEYQCSRGVNIKSETAILLGEEAAKHSILLSIHAPYYINLATDDERRDKSIDYILQTIDCAKKMDAKRVVVHSGSCAKIPRDEALSMAKETLQLAIKQDNSNIYICPETMGKINQLGDLDEVLEMCRMSEKLLPCIDFGHLNARTFGGLAHMEDFERVFDKIENEIGIERARIIHCHYSRIEFTPKGGEKKHHTFEDRQYGPDFEPIAKIMSQRGYNAVIICESMDVMAEDAVKLKKIYGEFYEDINN